jgi:hypothetical protein
MDMDEEMTTMHMYMHTDMKTAIDMDTDMGGIDMDIGR